MKITTQAATIAPKFLILYGPLATLLSTLHLEGSYLKGAKRRGVDFERLLMHEPPSDVGKLQNFM